MDAIKGTMTEIYNDLSKNTTGSTIAEVSILYCLHGAALESHQEATTDQEGSCLSSDICH